MSEELNQPTPVTQNRSCLGVVFLSPKERRLRAGWRLLIQTILLFFLVAGVGVGFSFSRGVLQNWVTGSMAGQQILSLISITGSVFLARIWLDRRSFSSIGLQIESNMLPDLLTGIAITGLQMGAIYFVFVGLGWSTFRGFAWDFDAPALVIREMILAFVMFILVGWNEELLSRGYHMQTLASGLNLMWGIIISSAIFGISHLANPHATLISAVGIFFAGVFLAYGYVRTGRLWLSIGLHIGWNFFEGVVFGFPVSGLDIYPLIRQYVHGPTSWTGGAFGPEAGLIVLPALALGAALIHRYTRNRKPEISF